MSLVDVSHALLKDSGMVSIYVPSNSPCEIVGLKLASVSESVAPVCIDRDHASVAVVVLSFEGFGEALIGCMSLSDAFVTALTFSGIWALVGVVFDECRCEFFSKAESTGIFGHRVHK